MLVAPMKLQTLDILAMLQGTGFLCRLCAYQLIYLPEKILLAAGYSHQLPFYSHYTRACVKIMFAFS